MACPVQFDACNQVVTRDEQGTVGTAHEAYSYTAAGDLESMTRTGLGAKTINYGYTCFPKTCSQTVPYTAATYAGFGQSNLAASGIDSRLAVGDAMLGVGDDFDSTAPHRCSESSDGGNHTGERQGDPIVQGLSCLFDGSLLPDRAQLIAQDIDLA